MGGRGISKSMNKVSRGSSFAQFSLTSMSRTSMPNPDIIVEGFNNDGCLLCIFRVSHVPR